MLRRATRTIAGCLCLFLASACTDTGDTSNGSGDDSSTMQPGDDTGTGTGADSQAGDDSSADGGVAADAATDTSAPRPDASDGATVDSGNPGQPDSGPTGHDAGDAAVTVIDAAAEAGVHDAAVDAAVDAGLDATVDAAVEAGVDASHDAAGDVGADAPADATQESSTGGVQCAGTTGGVCTPTEALFARHAPSCYECLFQAGCVDDAPAPVGYNDTQHECSDVTGDTLVAGKTRVQACLDVIACTLAHASAQPTLDYGYCGAQPTTVSCTTATPGQTGPCLLEEQTGLESTDPTTLLGRYTNTMYGGGMANQVFQCAISNMCATCL